MRLPLLACIVAATGLTFFAATRSIDARSTSQSDMATANDILTLQAELEVSEVRALDTISRLKAAKEDHDNNQAKLMSELEQARSDLAEAQNKVADLAGAADASLPVIKDLNAQLAAAKSEAIKAAERSDKLKKEAVDTAEKRSNGLIAELQEVVRENNRALQTSQARVAVLLDEARQQGTITSDAIANTAVLETQLSELRMELGQVTSALVERDTEIQKLRASVVVPVNLTVESCTEKTDALLAQGTIDFKTGTDELEPSTFVFLQQLADVAFDCTHSSLLITIGGHTDSQGGESSNQLHSEKRAAAIRSFFGRNGVSASSMRVVGYGESKPIADNSTAAGRAENRRITLDWQQR